MCSVRVRCQHTRLGVVDLGHQTADENVGQLPFPTKPEVGILFGLERCEEKGVIVYS